MFYIFIFVAFFAIFCKKSWKSQILAKNDHFWAEKPKNQKYGIVRPSGFLKHYWGQKMARKYQLLEELLSKICFKKCRFCHILGCLGEKSPKMCQLWRHISRKQVNIFRFRKKFLAPHNQELKICPNGENQLFRCPFINTHRHP